MPFRMTRGTRSSMRFAVAAIALAALAGCSAAPTTTPPQPAPESLNHIHGIVAAGDGRTVYLGTHTGIYTADDTGILAGPLGAADFDAMGLTVIGDSLVASGHPGPTTPTELGSPNLGIILSEDGGESWQPIAFTGVEDFHVLTSAPDGRLYGIGSSSNAVLTSTDRGVTWSTGAVLAAADMTVAADDALYAATPEGLQVSTDAGATFTAIADAPLLYGLETTPEGAIVGVDTDGTLWRSADGQQWEPWATAEGAVQALGVAGDGTVVLVDDRGLVWMLGTGVTIVPLQMRH